MRCSHYSRPSLDGKPRAAVWIFLGGLTVKLIAYKAGW
jgi:hypothetical protein